MARRRDQIIALVMAIVFFATSVGVGLLVVWQAMDSNKQEKNAVDQSTDKNATGGTLQGKQLESFTPVAQVTELKVEDIRQGTGTEVKAGDTITFDYTGAVAATGIIFQSSIDAGQPATYPLTDLIPGWQEGIPGMKAGGKRRLIIPAEKAYGAQEQPGIPANSALVFDIEVHSVGE